MNTPTVKKSHRRERSYRQAVAADPKSEASWKQLARFLEDQGRVSEAAGCLLQMLDAVQPEQQPVPGRTTVHDMLREAVNCAPKRKHFHLGRAYEQLNDHERARFHLSSALEDDPSVEGWVHGLFAAMHLKEEKLADVAADMGRAMQANPNDLMAMAVRTEIGFKLCRSDITAETIRAALKLAPDAGNHSALMFHMNYLAETTPQMLYDEARRWNQLYAAPLASQIRPHVNTPDPERRLKIGYVSPDLYAHAVMKFLPPYFVYHDRTNFELFVYSVTSKKDEVTGWVEQSVDHYVPIAPSYEALAERIRADGIDILVDLAGHTMGAAYLAFALKPAPVQVSWLGMLGTTGMATMDYFFGCEQIPYPGTEQWFTETVYRLPASGCCYRPFDSPAISTAPYFSHRYITFGSYNNPRKITREVAKLWAAILHLVPRSRLLLKYQDFDREEVRKSFESWFVEDGIAAERVEFSGASPSREYLSAYKDIDIALDPFPYNGGSTTLDALWMGVPVVTLRGYMPMATTGASLLQSAGMPEFVASTPEQYLKIAVYLASVVPQVPDFRHEIRKALQSSPIMDEPGSTRSLENAFRDIWRRWCRTRQTP